MLPRGCGISIRTDGEKDMALHSCSDWTCSEQEVGLAGPFSICYPGTLWCARGCLRCSLEATVHVKLMQLLGIKRHILENHLESKQLSITACSCGGFLIVPFLRGLLVVWGKRSWYSLKNLLLIQWVVSFWGRSSTMLGNLNKCEGRLTFTRELDIILKHLCKHAELPDKSRCTYY